jgi:hypothetical protein
MQRPGSFRKGRKAQDEYIIGARAYFKGPTDWNCLKARASWVSREGNEEENRLSATAWD